jgi:hypothetical protein
MAMPSSSTKPATPVIADAESTHNSHPTAATSDDQQAMLKPKFTQQSQRGADRNSNNTSLADSDSDLKPTMYLRYLQLAPGTSPISFTAYLLASFMNICLFVFINASQGFVLSQLFFVEPENLGNVSGTLTFIDQILSLICLWIWGLASDKIGRVIVYSVGFGIMAVALAAYTFVPTVFPGLLAIRLVFAVGGTAASSMLTAVLADYGSDKVSLKAYKERGIPLSVVTDGVLFL